MTHLKFSEVKAALILKAEDRAQLRDTRVAGCGKDRKAHQHLHVPHTAVKCRCQEIDKDMAILVKFLKKVKMSNGHLTQRYQHGWSDGSLPEE